VGKAKNKEEREQSKDRKTNKKKWNAEKKQRGERSGKSSGRAGTRVTEKCTRMGRGKKKKKSEVECENKKTRHFMETHHIFILIFEKWYSPFIRSVLMTTCRDP